MLVSKIDRDIGKLCESAILRVFLDWSRCAVMDGIKQPYMACAINPWGFD